jgi:hypothetical protein
MKEDIVYDGKVSSNISEPEKRVLELIGGSEPQNESEIQLLKEIQELMKSGKVVDIPQM